MASKKTNTAIEKELLKDERVQKKIAEYEEMKKEAEESKKRFNEKYERLNKDFEVEYEIQLYLVGQQKKQLEIERQKAETAREDTIREIQKKEEIIRGEYREELMAKWQAEYDENIANMKKLNEEAKAKANEIKDEAFKELQDSKQKAYEIRLDAENEKIRILDETRRNNEEKFKIKSKEIEEKLKDLTKKEIGIKRQLQEFYFEKEEFEVEKEMLESQREYLKSQREKYSPLKLEALNDEIRVLKELRDYDKAQIDKLNKRIIHLNQFVGEDENRSIETIVEELESQKSENQRLRDELSNLPSSYEVEELRAKADNIENLKRVLDEEKRKRIEAQNTADSLSIGVVELQQTKKVAQTLRSLNQQLQEELEKINNMHKESTSSKFPGLLNIDKQLETKSPFAPNKTNKNLVQLVDYIRNYGAAREGLYYSHKTIRSFVASLASSKLLILQGLSGTGKSSLPRLFKEALDCESSLVPIQPSFRDNRELLGYDNDFTKRFKETEFTKFLYEASSVANRDKIWFIVLDEMNLARIEYYFADFLSILEKKPEEWIIPLVSSNEELNQENIPKNLINGTSLFVTQNIWFIGTANRDESTFGITDKVYDRAQVLDFNNRENTFNTKLEETIKISYSEFDELTKRAIRNSSLRLNEEDWFKLDEIDEMLKEKLDITFGNRVKSQIDKFVPVYVACGGSKEEAIDYLLTHKVLRKLENRYEIYLREGLNDLIELIELLYGKGVFVESIALIEQKIQRLGG